MEENMQNPEKECEKKVKQQITVPFLWEERPGAPKKDWKPKSKPSPPPVPLPVKYIASIPFKWEEKPGTPLRCFAQEPKELTVQETGPENRCLPLPPAYFTKYRDESDEESSYGDDYDEPDWTSDFEALSINSEESFSSAPSYLAKKDSVSSAVRLQNPFLMQQNDGHTECPSSPKSSTSQSGYSPGNASLRGALFLEQLFPLYAPKSGFLDKAGNSAENDQHPENEKGPPSLAEHKKFVGECRRSGVIRRPLTLAELIMMSRRRSYRRKAVHMKKQKRPREFTKNNAHGCFNFGANGGGIAKLFGKDLLTVKLA